MQQRCSSDQPAKPAKRGAIAKDRRNRIDARQARALTHVPNSTNNLLISPRSTGVTDHASHTNAFDEAARFADLPFAGIAH